MSDWLGAYLRAEGSALRLGSEPIDQQCREQIALAAQLLRAIRPHDGDVEILLHEMARALERVADTGSAGSVPLGVSAAQLDACASALE
jgi:hypothetical protein